MERAEAFLVLNCLPGIGPGRWHVLEEYYDNPVDVLNVPASELSRINGIGPRLAEVLVHWQKYCNIGREIRLATDSGVYLMTREDPCYPPSLLEIHDPPLCLYVRGSLECLRKSAASLAFVGSRRTSEYGRRMAARLVAGAVENGWIVVSGLAHGIDTVSHQATLEHRGLTIGVIGSGLCRFYPPDNLNLANKICEAGGAIISEFPLEYPPDRRSFPMRNRIISGISQGTVVVEGSLQSGSLITASQAISQGRSVFAVPGMADQFYAQGCHALIKDGARLVENFKDIQDEFQLLPAARKASRERQERLASAGCPVPEIPPVKVTEIEYAVWSVLGDAEETVEGVIEQLDEPVSLLLAAILSLEIKGVLRQLPGRRLQRLPDKKVQKLQ